MGKLTSITFDCEDPVRSATFWAAALDEYMTDARGDRVTSESGGPFLYFQKVPEAKVGKTRVHLDLATTDAKGDIFRMQRMGAKIIGEHDEGGHKWTVLQDPEGVEFCVVDKAP